MTSDTTLADWLTDPATGIARRYVVTVRGELSDDSAQVLTTGVRDRGETLAAASIDILKRSKRETHLIVELTEGRNREIRRMLKAAGHEVTRLKRIAFGGIELGNLGPGKWRNVSADELRGAFPKAPLQQTELKSLPTHLPHRRTYRHPRHPSHPRTHATHRWPFELYRHKCRHNH